MSNFFSTHVRVFVSQIHTSSHFLTHINMGFCAHTFFSTHFFKKMHAHNSEVYFSPHTCFYPFLKSTHVFQTYFLDTFYYEINSRNTCFFGVSFFNNQVCFYKKISSLFNFVFFTTSFLLNVPFPPPTLAPSYFCHSFPSFFSLCFTHALWPCTSSSVAKISIFG